MAERMGGTSSISPLRSVYYMVKVSIALVVFRHHAPGSRKGGPRMNVRRASSPTLRLGLVAWRCGVLSGGSSCGCLKKGRLTVRYSIIWLISAGALLRFRSISLCRSGAAQTWLGMAVPVNVVFTPCASRSSCFCCSAFPASSPASRKRSSALRRKTPSWKSACADWKRSSRRRISKRKTKKPRNAPSKGGDSLSKKLRFSAKLLTTRAFGPVRRARRPSAAASLYTCLGTGPAGASAR